MVEPSKCKSANDQRQETHPLKMGFDGNEFNWNDLKREENWKNEPNKRPLESGNEKGTFWTVCPYCFYMYEYESKYEECCLLCQNCRKGFHGLAVAAPPESSLVKGEGAECYSGHGFFPLGCFADSFLGDKKDVDGADTGKEPVIVEISDDSDDEKKERDARNKGTEVQAEILNNGEERGAMKRVKSVPKSTRKMMGRGIRGMKVETVLQMNVDFEDEIENGDGNEGSAKRASVGGGSQDGSNEDNNLEFFEGDDDIFVGLRDVK